MSGPSSEQWVRILRAKEGEYENMFKQRLDHHSDELCFMMADLSLLFGALATHIEHEIQEM